MKFSRWTPLVLLVLVLSTTSVALAADQGYDYSIKLRTGEFAPDRANLQAATAAPLTGKHIIVQLDGPVSNEDRERLEAAGITLQGYIPNFAFIALVDQSLNPRQLDLAGVRWMGQITPDLKVDPELREVGFRDYSKHDGDRVQLVVVFHDDANPNDWLTELRTSYQAEIIGVDPIGNSVDLIVPESLWATLARIEAVQWIDQALPRPREDNNNSRVNTRSEYVQLPPLSLSGNGITVAEWDGGRADGSHIDLLNKVTYLDYAAFANHATHVAGTILGTGASRTDLRYRGMAPDAQLLSQLWWSNSSEMVTEYGTVINSYGASVATNSWGYGVDPVTTNNCVNTLGTYYPACTTIDRLVNGSYYDPIAITWSAGNERSLSSDYCGSIGWTYNTIGALACAKNVITVGAIVAGTDAMTSFSSWGPTDDGRVKPDVVGPGSGVVSCKVGSGYTTMSGTSMSTPAVAGVLALLYEQREINFPGSPVLPSTMKGILINTAEDLGRIGPDYEYGHGKVNAETAAYKVAIGEPSYVESQISTGENHIYDLTVPGNSPKLKVTIVWDDVGGTTSSSVNLINDLNLELVDPFGASHYSWTLSGTNPTSPAQKGVDATNNVETAEVDNPLAGLWKARVSGFNIPQGPQNYSIVFTPDSINTPGNLSAVAVYDAGDQVINPGVTIPLNFWISNIGAEADSFDVAVSGDPVWLNTTIDTVVYLAPYDSALVTTSATVPALALAGDNTSIMCQAIARSDTLAVGTDYIVVSAAQVFAHAVSTNVIEDTINSPDTFLFSVNIENLGNAADQFTVEPSGETDWTFYPGFRSVLLNYQKDTTVEFTAYIPAEVPDGSDNQVTVTATSSGGPVEVANFNLVGNNPVFPPSLIFPASPSYLQDATPTFEWSSDGDSYNLYIAYDSLITNLAQVVTGITSTSIELDAGQSLSDGTYFWGVKKFVGADSSSLQRFPFKIQIDNIPPVTQQPLIPVNRYLNNQTATFSWSNLPGETPNVLTPEYNILRIASDAGMTADLSEYEPINGNSYVAGPLDEGRWYWTIQRADSAGNLSAMSTVATFVVDTTQPAVPYDLQPLDSSAAGGDTIMFSWTTGPPPSHDIAPEYFYLHISSVPTFGDYSTFAQFVYNDTVKVPTSILNEYESYWWRVKSYDSAGYYSDYTPSHTFFFGDGLCGDFNGDSKVNLADITSLIAYVYLSGPSPIALSVANVNCDDKINLADITKLIDFVYLTKSPLCCSQP